MTHGWSQFLGLATGGSMLEGQSMLAGFACGGRRSLGVSDQRAVHSGCNRAPCSRSPLYSVGQRCYPPSRTAARIRRHGSVVSSWLVTYGRSKRRLRWPRCGRPCWRGGPEELDRRLNLPGLPAHLGWVETPSLCERLARQAIHICGDASRLLAGSTFQGCKTWASLKSEFGQIKG